MFASKEEFIMKGSDWIFSKVIYLEICYAIYSPLKGGNYIKEPMELQRSRSLVNIKNNDQKCFLYSVLAKLYPAKHNPSRLCHYLQHTNKLNMNGIQYPVHLSQIPKFENQNDISINVFGYEDKEIFPMRITKSKRKSHVDLLYFKKQCSFSLLSEKLESIFVPNRGWKRWTCTLLLPILFAWIFGKKELK